MEWKISVKQQMHKIFGFKTGPHGVKMYAIPKLIHHCKDSIDLLTLKINLREAGDEVEGDVGPTTGRWIRGLKKALRFGAVILHGLTFVTALDVIFHDCLHVGKIVKGAEPLQPAAYTRVTSRGSTVSLKKEIGEDAVRNAQAPFEIQQSRI
ncbi:hypothetical protein METBIDRAFT_12285 [Metschnikowia bicuspidata var. bicuspidata NRRL YB-4993]|uniref:Uncharacterized protein n=1 Tax=Metschnikowia bicuspidata var. bicuspidata NRRL YB-4993 TaxID=869754 RepID=A0A1A0H8M7_9ASCO|nr:hypothetical protein METBIDRAFT_12285 [Metschnikowia bicuspidata var. bicuspidata NRRL YB-4993]OBA20238.1 hypothetical protein METBIDRAFT_12285 [Metschnikowia bicuspidata var. bicuspidata NRRL YB-4993]